MALFSWRFIVPLVIFFLCYLKIISSLRRTAKVRVSQREQPIAGPSTSTAPPATSGHSKPASKSQRNVIKTMLVVTSFFIVCWMPFQFLLVCWQCGLPSLYSTTLYWGLAILAAVHKFVNPFIYAAGLYQPLRAMYVAGFRRLMRRENQVTVVVQLRSYPANEITASSRVKSHAHK